MYASYTRVQLVLSILRTNILSLHETKASSTQSALFQKKFTILYYLFIYLLIVKNSLAVTCPSLQSNMRDSQHLSLTPKDHNSKFNALFPLICIVFEPSSNQKIPSLTTTSENICILYRFIQALCMFLVCSSSKITAGNSINISFIASGSTSHMQALKDMSINSAKLNE